MNTTHNDRRAAATEQFERGKAAVSAVFDATDGLRSVLANISLSATGADPLRAAADVAAALPHLESAVASLRQRAEAASNYATKAELAGHADTKPVLLFIRPEARATRPVGRGAAVDPDALIAADGSASSSAAHDI